jgi:hypothetical protein
VEEKIHQNDNHGKFFEGSVLSKDDWAPLSEARLVQQDDPWSSFLTCLEGANCSEAAYPKHIAILPPTLTKLGARYILLEKHRGKLLDGVARFHLGNGAMVHRINFGADLSRKGLQNSFGIMMNY